MTDEEKKKLWKSYFYKGVTVFLVVAACLSLYFFFEKLPQISDAVAKVFAILQPVVFGLVIAYLLNPIFSFLCGKTNKILAKKIKSEKKCDVIARAASVTVSVLFFLLIIFLLLYLIVPQFITSVSNLITVLPGQIDAWSSRFSDMLQSNRWLKQVLTKAFEYEKDWLETDLTGSVNRYAAQFASGVWNFVNFLKNIALGLIFTIYLLYHKERFIRLSRKVLYVVFPRKTVAGILKVGGKANKVFSGFISGQLVDAAIVGVLCFIGVSIIRVPYAMLIAVIIGATNIIPVFGPYLGGIPCGLLIFLTDPIKCLYFVIFIVLLQMLDGNVIAPKILGTTIGIDSFWVVFAIILGGGLFGIIGMVLGVPTFAILYYLMRSALNARLRKKNLPVDIAFYDENVVEKIKIHPNDTQRKEGEQLHEKEGLD